MAMERALELSLQYMSEREAFGRPINKFQVLRHRVAQLASEIEALKAFSYHCCKMYDDGIYDVKLCSMAKLLATELAEKVATQCLQFYGGYGFMEEYPMARMYRDVRVGTIGGGSSEIMREIIAKMVIDDVNYDKADSSDKGIVPRAKTNGDGNASSEQGLSSILKEINQKAASAEPIGKTLKFDFGGQQLYIDGTGTANEVSQNNGDADCTIRISQEDFKRLIKGDLNPMGAVMSGKIKIDGDMGVAMKLQSLFS
jgi:putative sterol carrier protein